ncbi:MAG: hypothetical protein ABFD89_21965 [Bryobacteraceae bacterium]
MANPAIGAVAVLGFSGSDLLVPHMRASNVTRDGVDGVALQKMGKRSAPVMITTVADVDDLGTWITAAEALIGTIVTVTTPDARSIPYVYVHDVQVVWPSTLKVLNPVGGLTAGQWVVTATWTLQNVSAA